ncbi:MAG: pyridoxamine 5'-phosphate oxidase family protein, partial [bacterium]
DGAFWCATHEQAKVLEYLRHEPECAFEVSPNEPPYKGVRGRGTAEIERDEDKHVLTRLIKRYLGDTSTMLGKMLLNSDREEYKIEIEPE